MRFACSKCDGIIEVEDTERGNPVGCGHCGKFIVVPEEIIARNVIINNDFILKDKLGQGGVGTVYEAHQISLDRQVALKILMDQFAQDKTFIEDFIREARSAARLNHPNIVQTFAVGQDGVSFFCAMEIIRGDTLKEVIAREGRISIKYSFQIMHQMAEAINFAWQTSQLVHRDIKPDNIMITEGGVGKLADLGLARVASESEAEGDEIMGTPQYISPEQLLGLKTDVRTDIYSLGATWYHAITGEFPFTADSPQDVAQMHLEATLVPPNQINTDIPKVLSVMICKMMAKHPDDRYVDAEELIKDIKLAEKRLKGAKTNSTSRGSSIKVPKTYTSRISKNTRTTTMKAKTGSRKMNTRTGSFATTGTRSLTKNLKRSEVTPTTKLNSGTKTLVLGKGLDTDLAEAASKPPVLIIAIASVVVLALLTIVLVLGNGGDKARIKQLVTAGIEAKAAVKIAAFETTVKDQGYTSSNYKNVLSLFSKVASEGKDYHSYLTKEVANLLDKSTEQEVRQLRKSFTSTK